MVWDETKQEDDIIEDEDWNDMVTVIKKTAQDQSDSSYLGSGNTYIEVDAVNNKIYFYISGVKKFELP